MENMQQISDSCHDAFTSPKPSTHLPLKSQFKFLVPDLKVTHFHKETNISLINGLELASYLEERHCLFMEKHPDWVDQSPGAVLWTHRASCNSEYSFITYLFSLLTLNDATRECDTARKVSS